MRKILRKICLNELDSWSANKVWHPEKEGLQNSAVVYGWDSLKDKLFKQCNNNNENFELSNVFSTLKLLKVGKMF